MHPARNFVVMLGLAVSVGLIVAGLIALVVYVGLELFDALMMAP